MHFQWHKAVGVVAVVVLCTLDASQSHPVAPDRSLDSTELYYLAHDSDDATSSYKPFQKKARLSSSAGGANGQQVGGPSSKSVSPTPPSTRQSFSNAYDSHSWKEKQGEQSTSDASWQMQVPRRPRSSSAQQKVVVGVSSLKTGPATQLKARQRVKINRKGYKFLTTAPGHLWDEGTEITTKYSTKGIVKAKALAIQQHVPEYPTTPEEYPMILPRRESKSRSLRRRRLIAHRDHVRRTYSRMATNQVDRQPLLKGVSLPVGQGDSRGARMAAMQRRLPLPTDAPLQDYRTLLSDSDIQEPPVGECCA